MFYIYFEFYASVSITCNKVGSHYVFSSAKMKHGFGRKRQYEPWKRPKAPTTRQSVILQQRRCDVTMAGTSQLSKLILKRIIL